MHAQILDNLQDAGVRVAFFDFIFYLPSGHGPEDDNALALAISKTPTVLATEQSTDAMSQPLPQFLDAGAREGVVLLPIDRDGIVRRMRNGDGCQVDLGRR